jgi:hypothetical protein
MLYRNSLSLSALSNRLNRGTRTLVLATSGNHGANAQRIRLSHHDVMRERMSWHVVPFSKLVKHDIPSIPGSPIPGCQQQEQQEDGLRERAIRLAFARRRAGLAPATAPRAMAEA